MQICANSTIAYTNIYILLILSLVLITREDSAVWVRTRCMQEQNIDSIEIMVSKFAVWTMSESMRVQIISLDSARKDQNVSWST